MRVPVSLVRTERAVAVAKLAVHDVASEIRTEEAQWKLPKVRHRGVITPDDGLWHKHVWPQEALVGFLRRNSVRRVEARTGQQDVVLENMALCNHVDKQATGEPGEQFSFCTVPMRTVVGIPQPKTNQTHLALSEANASDGLTSRDGTTSRRPRSTVTRPPN